MEIVDKINNLNIKQKVSALFLMLIIFSSLFYLIKIQGDYSIVYDEELPFYSECIEHYENNKLVSEPCPQANKTNEPKYNIRIDIQNDK